VQAPLFPSLSQEGEAQVHTAPLQASLSPITTGFAKRTRIKPKGEIASRRTLHFMKIYRPVATNLITQGFGLAGTQPSLLPLYNSLGLKAHNGIDFAVACKDNHVKHGGLCEPVYSNVEGDGELTVTFVQKDDEKGWGIIAVDESWNKFLWWHFDIIDPLIYVGKKLLPGTLLGTSGNTGISTGSHVHFQYDKYGQDATDGYQGATDPTPYYDNRFILDIEKQIGIIKSSILAIQNLITLLFGK
jgi:hypothetical protein